MIFFAGVDDTRERLHCHRCEYYTTVTARMEMHIKRHDVEPNFQCPKCLCLFLEEKYLTRHKNFAHIGITKPTRMTGRRRLMNVKKEPEWSQVDDTTEPQQYIMGKDKDGKLVKITYKTPKTEPSLTTQCLQCEEIFSEEIQLTKHITIVHPEINNLFRFISDDLVCKKCYFTTDSLSIMHSHIQMHVIGCIHHCSTCKELFLDEESLNIHTPHCLQSLTDSFSEQQAKLLMFREENRCLLCHKIYSAKKHLQKHQLEVHHVTVTKLECEPKPRHAAVDDDQRTTDRGNAINMSQMTKVLLSSKAGLNHHSGRLPDEDDKQQPEEGLVYQCDMCSLTFLSLSDLKEHIKKQHTVNLPCPVCDNTFINDRDLHKHIRVKHQKHACNFCPYIARNPESLDSHERHHLKSSIEKCILCISDETFSNLGMLELHYRMSHNIEVVERTLSEGMKTIFYACTVCTFESFDIDEFDGHQAEHARKLKFRCTLCERSFQNRFSALQHQKKNHAVEIKKKEEELRQNQPIKEKTDTFEDMNMDTGLSLPTVSETLPDTITTNNITNEPFSDIQTIAEAMTQLDNISNSNTEKQDKTGVENKTQEPQEATTAEEPEVTFFEEFSEYVCDQCNKVFSKYFALKRHQATVHQKRVPESEEIVPEVKQTEDKENETVLFKCDECNKVFSKCMALTQHKKNMHPKEQNVATVFTCDVCSKTFRKCFALHQHKKRFHGETSPELVFDEDKGKLFRASDMPVRVKKRKRSIYEIEEYSVNNVSNITDGVRLRKCRMCAATFRDSLSLMRHIRLEHSKLDTDDPEDMSSDEDNNIEYKCTICSFTTDNPRVFSAHEQSHKEQPSTLYECHVCNVKFTRLENLNKHYLRVHNNVSNVDSLVSQNKLPENPVCWVCSHQTMGKEQYQNHMSEAHKFNLKCEKCYFCGESTKQLDWHAKKHEKGACLNCKFCFHLFYESRALDVHVSKVHGQQPETAGDIAESAHNTGPTVEMDVASENTGQDFNDVEAAMQAATTDTSSTALSTDELQHLQALKQALEEDLIPTTQQSTANEHQTTVHQQPADTSQQLGISSITSISGDQYNNQQVVYMDGTNYAAGQTTTQQLVNEHGQIVNEQGQIVNEQGQVVENQVQQLVNEQGQLVNEQGQLINEHGQLINEQGQPVENQTQQLVNEHGQIVNEQGEVIQNQTQLVNEHGQLVNEQGQLIDEHGQVVENQVQQLVNEHGQFVNEQGQLIDEQGQVVENQVQQLVNEQGQLVNEQGQLINEQGQLINEQGQIVENQLVNEHGQLVNEQGQLVNEQGQVLENQGQIVDGQIATVTAESQQLVTEGVEQQYTSDGQAVYATDEIALQPGQVIYQNENGEHFIVQQDPNAEMPQEEMTDGIQQVVTQQTEGIQLDTMQQNRESAEPMEH